jgi:hypothetical protein
MMVRDTLSPWLGYRGEAMSETNEATTPGTRWRVLAQRESESIQWENEGVLDEVVVDDWLHLEQMDARQWWLRLGDARILISIEPSGKARVDIERGSYEQTLGETKSD